LYESEGKLFIYSSLKNKLEKLLLPLLMQRETHTSSKVKWTDI
jgi:hypothetical protein